MTTIPILANSCNVAPRCGATYKLHSSCFNAKGLLTIVLFKFVAAPLLPVIVILSVNSHNYGNTSLIPSVHGELYGNASKIPTSIPR